MTENSKNINEKNEQGQTKLHIAAQKGLTETVKELIKLGANINAKDKEGYTALYLAAQNGHTKTVKELKELEANINEKDKRGNTALHAAALYGHTGTVEALIKAKTDIINATNEEVQTALHLAAQNGRTETVKELIKLGANINEKDKRDNTALHEATLYGRTETVKALIEAGADINAKNEQDNTAFCLAASIGNIPIVGLLLPDDPSKHINSKGYTPLHFLSTLYQSKKDELIETLKEVENREKYLNLLKGIEDRIADFNTAEIERKIAEDSHYKGDIVTPEYLMKLNKDTDTAEYLQDLKDDLQEVLFGGITKTLLKEAEVGKVECNYENDELSSVKIVITPEADSSFKSMVRGTTSNQLKDKLKKLGFEANSDNKLEATVGIDSMRDFINTYKTCCHLLTRA